MKGKNFSCNNTGKRKKSDYYETPYCLTQELLNIVQLKNPEYKEPIIRWIDIQKYILNKRDSK